MASLATPGNQKQRTSSAGRPGGRTLSRNEPQREYCVYTPVLVSAEPGTAGGVEKVKQANIDADSVIVNELLCYITQYMHSTTNAGLKAVCARYFSDEDIAIAKGIIWSLADAHLSSFKSRNDSKLRSAAEADLNDLLDALGKIDGKVKLPTFAAVNIDKMPRFNPEDLDLFSLNERLSQLEKKFELHECMMEKRSISSVMDSSKLYSSAVKSPTVPNVTKAQPPKQSATAHTDEKGKKPPPTKKGTSLNHEIKDAEGFEFPRYHRKRLRANQNDNVVKGNASPSKIRGAALTRDMFVSHLDRDTNAKDLEDHIKEKGIVVIDIEQKSNEKANLKSFKVKVNKSDYEKMMDPEIWPRGVQCRAFFYRRPGRFDPRIRNVSGISKISSVGTSEIDTLANYSGDISADDSLYS